MTKQKLPQPAQIAITVAAFLLLAIVGYFVAVKPQKSKASSLSAQIAAKDSQISDARALLAKAKDAQKVRVADLFRLTKAMPDSSSLMVGREAGSPGARCRPAVRAG